MPESDLPSPLTVSALLILTTVLHAFALILTSFRLWFRYHIRRLWWDDFWATLALFCDTVCMVVMWTLSSPIDDSYTDTEALPTNALSRRAHIVSFWLAMIFYTCVIWFARISIVCSVVRIVPPSRCVSIMSFGIGAAFFCVWIYVLSCKSVVCAQSEQWYDSRYVQCPIPLWVALSEISTDAISDLVLVILPLRLLWRVKLPANQRIMVLSVFSTSILVSVVSAVHTSYIIPEVTFIGGATAQIGGAISLIVCNLLVIVTFLYRVTRNGRDLTAGLSDKHLSSHRLTTVDLAWFTTTEQYNNNNNNTTVLSGTHFSSLAFSSSEGSSSELDPVTTCRLPGPNGEELLPLPPPPRTLDLKDLKAVHATA